MDVRISDTNEIYFFENVINPKFKISGIVLITVGQESCFSFSLLGIHLSLSSIISRHVVRFG